MKKTISLFILALVLFSCGEKKEPISFQKIEVNITDQWGRQYDLQIDSIGNTQTLVNDKQTAERTQSFLINEQILDSISHVVQLVDITKIDTVYKDSCDMCVAYKIMLQKNGKTVSAKVENIDSNPEAQNLDQLASLLYNVVRTSDQKPDVLKRKEKK
ncbi:MAG: hypothetical protein ACK5L7_02175 [Paludibacteraceae bacterium]